MVARNFTGSRGESICSVLLTQICPGKELPFFKPIFLGERFETLDFMVELVDAGESTPFFFVQVKTTREGRTTRGNLKVKVPQKDMRRLQAYPVPTYIVGIDEVAGTGYIVSANTDSPKLISSLPTAFELDCVNLERLWTEVRDFWRQRDMSLNNSVFSV